MKMDTKLNNSNDSFMRQIFQMFKGGFEGLAKAITSLGKDVQKIEIQGLDVITIKGKDGKDGKDGHTPTDEELLTLITPLIPQITQPQDGHTPTDEELLALIRPLIPEVKNGETPTDEQLLALIKPLINHSEIAQEAAKLAQAELKPLIPVVDSPEDLATKLDELPKEWLSIDHIRGDFNTKIRPVIVPPAKTEIRVFDEGGNSYYIDRLNFAGSGVTLVKMADGVASVIIPGGSVGTTYTETPTGAINGSNLVYTVLHDITTVFSFAINGQFIHPNEYTATGNEITFNSPISADLAGTNFTLVYA